MKLYRIHTQLKNGCYSPGFYHPDREFLIEAMKQSLAQYAAEETEGITFFIEETEVNLTPITIGGDNGTQPTQSPETGSQDQGVSGPEQPGAPSSGSDQSGLN